MKIEKLGEDIYKVNIGFFVLAVAEHLGRALAQIQDEGKAVTTVVTINTFRSVYLVCTSSTKK